MLEQTSCLSICEKNVTGRRPNIFSKMISKEKKEGAGEEEEVTEKAIRTKTLFCLERVQAPNAMLYYRANAQ